ncbi:helix-turn-helix domain-containing protein [Streptomyces sp. HUCO-GS316]|nr:helix-turn-helix domain-containing protein [Streptomyces sp. HUCO-GS316]
MNAAAESRNATSRGHRNAPLTAAEAGISRRGLAKWYAWRAHGENGLLDRSSRPSRCREAAADRCDAVGGEEGNDPAPEGDRGPRSAADHPSAGPPGATTAGTVTGAPGTADAPRLLGEGEGVVEAVIADGVSQGPHDRIGIVVGAVDVERLAITTEADRAGAGGLIEHNGGGIEVRLGSEPELVGVVGGAEHQGTGKLGGNLHMPLEGAEVGVPVRSQLTRSHRLRRQRVLHPQAPHIQQEPGNLGLSGARAVRSDEHGDKAAYLLGVGSPRSRLVHCGVPSRSTLRLQPAFTQQRGSPRPDTETCPAPLSTPTTSLTPTPSALAIAFADRPRWSSCRTCSTSSSTASPYGRRQDHRTQTPAATTVRVTLRKRRNSSIPRPGT